jgi:PKD repeat protein
LNFINESTPDSELTSWRWNFGDGSPTSTEKNPLHIFPYAGTFTVSLTVNRGAQQNIAQKQITVYAGSLNPEFTASAVTGLAPLTVNFANSTANVTSWTWTISSSTGSSSGYTYVSGNANAQNIGVRFDFAGTYIVKLSISNGINTRTSEKSIVVTSSSTPVVDFTWQGPVYENNPVFFKNLTRYACSGIPSNRWTFSDFLGGTSNASSPLYNFSTAGTYAVSLCITDDCGQVNLCKTKLVKVLKPVNNLIPFFLVDNPTIKKGQTIKFFDRTQPPSDIKWWTWWFEQPKDLTSENPVQDNQSVLFLSPQPEGVSHTYNTSGTYKVRLYVGTGLTSGNYPVPSDAGVYYEQLVFVNETPEPVPGFTKQENQTVVVNGGAAGVKMIDLVQSENRYAVLKDQNGVNGAMPKSIINIYTKFAEDDWRLSGGYQTPTSGSLANSMIKDIALKKNNLMMRMDNGRYQMMTGTTTPIQLPLLSGVAFADSPQFDVYENEAVIVQNELAGRYLYLLTKTGATWGSAILAKYKISDGGFTGKVFIDQFAIIVQEGSDINIYERLNGNWDFSTKKTIRSKSLEPFRDFSYSENAIIVAGRSSSCPSLNVPIAYIYERPANGWVDNLDPTADLLLDVDSDISESTKICLDNVVPTSFTPNFVNISGNYAVVKVNLVNGANLVTRAYVYKKFDGFWRNTNDTYKLNNGERGLPTVTSNTDLVNGFSNATPGGKVEVYSYKNYCLLPPFDQTSNSISGIQQEVTRGIIRLGGAGGVVINSGAKITYVATGITLRPGFTAKEGSTAKFKAVATCDDLYFR